MSTLFDAYMKNTQNPWATAGAYSPVRTGPEPSVFPMAAPPSPFRDRKDVANASYLVYKRMVSRRCTTMEERGLTPPAAGSGLNDWESEDDTPSEFDTKVSVEVYDLTNPEAPKVVMNCSLSQLKGSVSSWTPHSKHWVNITPQPTSTLGLAQAMIILQEALDLPPFSVLDALQGGSRVRLDSTETCVYTSLLTFFLDQPTPATSSFSSRPSAAARGSGGGGGISRPPLQVVRQALSRVALLGHNSQEAFVPPSTGTLMRLFQMMMSGEDALPQHLVAPSTSSRVAQAHNPCFDRGCFFLTRQACVSIWGSNRHTIPHAVSHWFSAGALHEHLLDRRQGPDYVYFRLVERCIHALQPVIAAYHQEITRFEDRTFNAQRAHIRADVDQTLQLHLVVRELGIIRHHLTPADRVLKQLLKMPTHKSTTPGGLTKLQLSQLAEEHNLEHTTDTTTKTAPVSTSAAVVINVVSGAAAAGGATTTTTTTTTPSGGGAPTTTITPGGGAVVPGGGVALQGAGSSSEPMPGAAGAGAVHKKGKKEDAIFSVDTIDMLEEVRDDCVGRQAELDMLCTCATDLTSLLFNLTAYRTSMSSQTLAGVSVIFLPITWVCGIYGTNFVILPELRWGVEDPDWPPGWAAGYMYMWLIMIGLAIFCTLMLRRMRIF